MKGFFVFLVITVMFFGSFSGVFADEQNALEASLDDERDERVRGELEQIRDVRKAREKGKTEDPSGALEKIDEENPD